MVSLEVLFVATKTYTHAMQMKREKRCVLASCSGAGNSV